LLEKIFHAARRLSDTPFGFFAPAILSSNFHWAETTTMLKHDAQIAGGQMRLRFAGFGSSLESEAFFVYVIITLSEP
jgi:hypothetical protein